MNIMMNKVVNLFLMKTFYYSECCSIFLNILVMVLLYHILLDLVCETNISQKTVKDKS